MADSEATLEGQLTQGKWSKKNTYLNSVCTKCIMMRLLLRNSTMNQRVFVRFNLSPPSKEKLCLSLLHPDEFLHKRYKSLPAEKQSPITINTLKNACFPPTRLPLFL